MIFRVILPGRYYNIMVIIEVGQGVGSAGKERITPSDFIKAKKKGVKIVMVTAYDY